MRLTRHPRLLLAGLLLLAGCGHPDTSATTSTSASTAAGSTVGVVAAENFWGDVVRQIGGARVTVTSIVSDPNADPHEYESSAKDAAALASARLVVENGVGYDDFMDKLLSVSPNAQRTVLNVATVLKITGDNPNPHLWYATARLPEVAAAVAAQLSTLDPAGAADFAANEKAFVASLQPITDTIAKIKAKYAGTKIAYTERVPGYLTEAAGLTLGNPASFTEAVEQGNDPSPADTAAFDAVISGKKVKVLLYNAQVTDQETDDIKALAARSGVPVVGVTETLPPTDASFQAWQLRQAEELLAALGG